MKKLLLVNMMPLLALIVFLFIGSCENNTPITSPNQQSLESIDQQLDELEKGVAELSQSVLGSSVNSHNADGGGSRDPKVCGNYVFPAFNATGTMTYKECLGDEDENTPVYDVSKLWANYTPKGQDLNYYACGKPQNPAIPTLSINKSQKNNYPFITWGFKYSHYYRVQKKINNGNWTNIPLINNCTTGKYDSNCGSNDDYEDTSVSLSSLSNNYS